MSMDDSNNSNIDSEMLVDNKDDQNTFERGETTKAFQKLSKREKYLMMSIMNADENVKKKNSKLQDLAEKIDKLKRKYVNAFRVRNPDLRHFKTE